MPGEKVEKKDKVVWVTPLEKGWHHTEIVTEKGSEKQHYTYEPKRKHYYR
jgi:hypothetical protein